MKSFHSSATAYLIAESVVYLAQNDPVKSLIQPQTIELSRYFADSRPSAEKIVFRAKQQKIFRPFFNALENFVIPGLQLHYQVRKLRLEEIARAALAEDFSQIVVFGAGFDTLALRLHTQYPNVNFIEIDHPATQAKKRKVIDERDLAKNNLHFIALDLGKNSSFDQLRANDVFQKNVRTLFIAEGLLMYLEPARVVEMFDLVHETGAEKSRFAFTFMERQNDGRLAFKNSSKLVDLWLKWKGEPFRWGMKNNDAERFLAAQKFTLQSLDSAENFRQRYLHSPEMKDLKLAEGESLCLAETQKTAPIYVNDIHSKLNQTRVAKIVTPESVGEIQATIKSAKLQNKFVAIAGGFHAMGGQQFLSDSILLNMSAMDRVLNFDIENGLIEVESGIHWNKLIEYTGSHQTANKHQFGIRQKQTGADNLSIGGAISANIHGRGIAMKPFIDDVESFKIIDANGDILNCSRQENAELFSLVIGGYGLFGIVISVVLRLSKRQKLRRVVKIEAVENVTSTIENSRTENFLYGDFQFAINPESDDFLNKGVFSRYQIVSDNFPISENQELSLEHWKELLFLAHADKQKAFELYSSFYLQTDGQIYQSDTHQLSVYVNEYHIDVDRKMQSACAASEMISEVYVPLDKLTGFLKTVAADFRAADTELIYGTVRFIKKDTESFLAWAKQDFACIVFNLHIEHEESKIEKAKIAFKKLIDRALDLNGSFYLTYHRWLEKRQILQAYPQMPKFLELKLKYDPDEIFQSDWYQFQKQCLNEN